MRGVAPHPEDHLSQLPLSFTSSFIYSLFLGFLLSSEGKGNRYSEVQEQIKTERVARKRILCRSGARWLPNIERGFGTCLFLGPSAASVPPGTPPFRCSCLLAPRSPLSWAFPHPLPSSPPLLLASPPPWLLNLGIACGFNPPPRHYTLITGDCFHSCVFKAFYRWIFPTISFQPTSLLSSRLD